MNKLPEDHDCEKNGCVPYDESVPDFHNKVTPYGRFCLACLGCGDPECCGCDEDCLFEPRKGNPIGDGTCLENS